MPARRLPFGWVWGVLLSTGRVTACAGLMLLATKVMTAQQGYVLAGAVVDTSGAVIVGAGVRISDERGASWRAVSDGRGEFRVVGLPAGAYVVQADRKEFVREVINARLGVGSLADLRIVLRPQAFSEQVTVVAREARYAEPETTTATKIAVAQRRVPNSVSVLTREQMNDQHMVNTWDALSQIAGVTAISNSGSQAQYHSRGSSLESQQDGIPSAMALSGNQQYDLAIYERVEVVRGPAGLLQGPGSFSGSANFVRKRPSLARSASALASMGSWNNAQVQAEVSQPLSGGLRSLAVVSATDRDYFYDRGHDRKWLGYGVLEWAPSSGTALGLTVVHQRDRTPGFTGLPAYTDGQFLEVSRSFNPYPDWNRLNTDTTDVGVDFRHRFARGWQVVGKVNRRRQGFFFHDSFPFSGVARATNTASYTRREFDFAYTSDGADVYVSGRLGREKVGHEWLVGMNTSRFESLGRGVNSNQEPALTLPNVVVANPPIVPEPSFTYRTGSHSTTNQAGLYTMLRSTFGGRVTTVLGGRWTHFDARARTVAPSTPTDWVPGAQAHMVLTPYGGAVLDVARDVSVYGSYSEIFVPQTSRQFDGAVLDPRVGRQWEVGAKGEHLSSRLLTALAVFDIRDRNRAYADPANPGFFVPLGETESRGWEAEITGRITSLLNLSASYTQLKTEYLFDRTLNGEPLSYWYPEHSLKAWSMWQVSVGPVKDVRIGAGVQAYSQSASGRDTVNAAGVITVAARRQSAYAVATANLSVPLQPHLALAVQVNNVFDRTYYTRLGGTNTYNTFGEPRNLLVSLRWQSAAR